MTLFSTLYWTWKKWRPVKNLRANLIGAYQFTRRRRRFKALLPTDHGVIWKNRPAFGDATATTAFDAHYLYQSVWAAEILQRLNPPDHVDVGSDLRWLALEQLQRNIRFVDIRPPLLDTRNMTCVHGSVTQLPFADASVASLSCMHVIEHIGLGRYGDSLDPNGDGLAAAELCRVLAPGGHLLFSTPVGQARICFDSHRIYSMEKILKFFSSLKLMEFALTDDAGKFHRQGNQEQVQSLRYGCGMFLFQKVQPHYPR